MKDLMPRRLVKFTSLPPAADHPDCIIRVNGSTLLSDGSNWHFVWTGEDDGAGSGLDADLLDGKHYSQVIADAVAAAGGIAFAEINSTPVTLTDVDLLKTFQYPRSASVNGAVTLPVLTGSSIVDGAWIHFINSSTKTVTVSRGNTSDGIRKLTDSSNSATFVMAAGTSAIFRKTPSNIWYVTSTSLTGQTITPQALSVPAGKFLTAGSGFDVLADTVSIAGNGGTPTYNYPITGFVPSQPASAFFTVSVNGSYDSGTGVYARLYKEITFGGVYIGSVDTLYGGAALTAYNSDATNFAAGAWNAGKVYPVIVSGALYLRFVGRTSAPVTGYSNFSFKLERCFS